MKGKPIAYPNLMDTMTNVVQAHKTIHSTVAGHASAHLATIEAKRRALSVKRDATRLMNQESEK